MAETLKRIAFYFAVLLLLTVSTVLGQKRGQGNRTLIVIFDGLRPDYITAKDMPHLYSLREKGSYGRDHHSVFPTVTRVNASSYATGSYPATHGLLGNTVFFPEVDKTRGLNTGDVNQLLRIKEATGDKLLTSVSIGKLLEEAGSHLMVFSSGSSGQAYLQNHTLSGGGIVHPEIILPERLKDDVIRSIGNPPASASPNVAQHEWVTRAWLEFALAADGPHVTAIWLSDPDGTAHEKGIGAPLTMESIKVVDAQLGKIIKGLTEKQMIDQFNIIVTADHGFVTKTGSHTLVEFLTARGLKKDRHSEDVVLAGNALYVRNNDRDVITDIVSALQEQPWIGAIFTKSKAAQSTEGWVQGTLSFETIHWGHARAADILVDYNWNHNKNAYGYAGSSLAPGTAGHGGASPYEIHIPLIACGPDFKKAYESDLPTSNIDIVPTILHLKHIPVPAGMDGRVLTELLATTPQKHDVPVRKETFETSVQQPWGIYHLSLERSVVGKQHYVNFTEVKRQYSTGK